jgi:hypothetical protein
VKFIYTVINMTARATYIFGWIRPTARHTEGAQRKALEAFSPNRIVVDGGPEGMTFEAMAKLVRKTDEVHVQHVHLLAPTIEGVAARMIETNERGGAVVEISSGLRSDRINDAIRMIAGSRLQFAGDKKVHSKAEARRKGKLGAEARGKWLDQFSPSMRQQLRAVWRSRDYDSNDAALKAMDEHGGVPGWSKMLAWRAFGPSGRMGGRRRKS